MKNPFRDLSRLEKGLWILSVSVITLSFVLSGGGDWLSMTASLIGVTALIFVAKGYVLGQALTVVFALFYGAVSFLIRYYGEMITYLGMTAPSAIATAVAWMRHPYQDSREVEICRISPRQVRNLILLTALATAVFYFILRALGNASLVVSTLSISTSVVASCLTFMRSPYYALGYAANDLVLIILWSVAAAQDISCLPMLLCFIMFLLNDLYGFFNWRRMLKRQSA
ncbi:MAG: nicotinamide mononucleotide transporter [Clostridia bacterium]|nr:nicotinamide mononucleotide transporter [Clostridia bacterium]